MKKEKNNKKQFITREDYSPFATMWILIPLVIFEVGVFLRLMCKIFSNISSNLGSQDIQIYEGISFDVAMIIIPIVILGVGDAIYTKASNKDKWYRCLAEGFKYSVCFLITMFFLVVIAVIIISSNNINIKVSEDFINILKLNIDIVTLPEEITHVFIFNSDYITIKDAVSNVLNMSINPHPVIHIITFKENVIICELFWIIWSLVFMFIMLVNLSFVFLIRNFEIIKNFVDTKLLGKTGSLDKKSKGSLDSEDTKSKCIDRGFFKYIVIRFFIILIIEILIVSNIDSTNYTMILIFISIFVLFIQFYICKFYKHRVKKIRSIKAKASNIDYEDVLKSMIICNPRVQKNPEHTKLFGINISGLIESGNSIEEIHVENHTSYVCDESNMNKTMIYYLHHLHGKVNTNLVILKLKIVETNKNSQKIQKKYKLFINTRRDYGNVFIYDTYATLQKVSKYSDSSKYKPKAMPDDVFYLLKSSVVNGTRIFEEEEHQETKSKEQKILLHDDKYGSGKSRLDIEYAQRVGKNPVVVSPWARNSSHDFLYSLMIEIREKTNMKVLKIINSRLYFYYFVVLIVAIGPVIELLTIVFDSKTYIFGLLVLFGIVIWSLFRISAVDWIIYKSSFVTYNKDTLVEQIVEAVKEKNLMLIIEDIDRMDGKEYNSVLRDLAHIVLTYNKYYYDDEAFIIVSVDSKNPYQNQDNTFTEHNQELLKIPGKLMLANIYKDYRCGDTIIDYLKNADKFVDLNNHYSKHSNTDTLTSEKARLKMIDKIKSNSNEETVNKTQKILYTGKIKNKAETFQLDFRGARDEVENYLANNQS